MIRLGFLFFSFRRKESVCETTTWAARSTPRLMPRPGATQQPVLTQDIESRGNGAESVASGRRLRREAQPYLGTASITVSSPGCAVAFRAISSYLEYFWIA